MLAAIKTPEDKNAVETFARSHNNIPVWTGGKVDDFAWRWNGLSKGFLLLLKFHLKLWKGLRKGFWFLVDFT